MSALLPRVLLLDGLVQLPRDERLEALGQDAEALQQEVAQVRDGERQVMSSLRRWLLLAAAEHQRRGADACRPRTCCFCARAAVDAPLLDSNTSTVAQCLPTDRPQIERSPMMSANSP